MPASQSDRPDQAVFRFSRTPRSRWDGFGCSFSWKDRQDGQKVASHNEQRSVCAGQSPAPQSEHLALAERPQVAPSASSRLRTSTTPQYLIAAEDYITDGAEAGIQRFLEVMGDNGALGKMLRANARIAVVPSLRDLLFLPRLSQRLRAGLMYAAASRLRCWRLYASK